jgi:hypothetical protein
MRSCATICALALFAPTSAQGQFGGLGKRVRRAVQDATAERPAETKSAEAASPAKEVAGPSPYNEHVLRITPELLGRLATGLRAEAADRAELARLTAAIRTPEDHQKCMLQATASQKGEAVREELRVKGEAFLENTSDAAAAAAYQQAQATVVAFMETECGPEPKKAASEIQRLNSRPEKAGGEAAGLTSHQYAILKERVTPLCGVGAATGEVRIPGEGKNIFWVYSPEEVSALAPRCGELLPLVQANA